MTSGGHRLRRVPAVLALVSACTLAQQTVEVSIQDYRFTPQEARIKAGDTVKWINREKRTSHSVLFPAENGLESERLFPAGTVAADLWPARPP
jgi:plastocyanin